MTRRVHATLLSLVLIISLTGAPAGVLQAASGAALGRPAAARPTPGRPGDPALTRGLAFLQRQYRPAFGLLEESPLAGRQIYWLTNDNALAAYTLDRLGERALARQLWASLATYGLRPCHSNNYIELLFDCPVSWPPRTATRVRQPGPAGATIWQEAHNGPPFTDWREYANLAFMGALRAQQTGQFAEARRIYRATLQLFDGQGFRDKAYRTHYETYKLALAIYVGRRLQLPLDARLEPQLRRMQDPTGGFVTLFLPTGPVGDANVETTAHALLALALTPTN